MASYLPTPKSKQPKPVAKPAPVVEIPPPPPPPDSGDKMFQPVRRKGLPDWARGALATIAIAIVLFVGYFTFSLVDNFMASGGKVISLAPPHGSNQGTLAPGVTPTLPPLPGPAYKPWNGKDRITILVMGLDYRDQGPEQGGPSRTDTMILLSMDPVTKTAGMLSIPRDLYVDIPGFGFNKINAAYFDAEAARLPQTSGADLAIQTVENLIGMPIDNYAVLNFDSFTQFVDEIGGIDVYVPFDNMVIGEVGVNGTKLLFFGWNHLTGAEALGFARNRSTQGKDFDRAARTQQVILAIRDKILNLNMLPTLLTKAPTLYNELSSGVLTNLSSEQIIQLAMIAKDIPRGQIKQGIIDYTECIATGNIPINGVPSDVLLPDPDKVHALRDKIFTSNGPLGYQTPPADFMSLALAENAQIQILNGSTKDGLATATKNYLISLGFKEENITVVLERPNYTATTQLYIFSAMPYTVRVLSDTMNIPPENIWSQVSLDQGIDMQLILGDDWTVPQT
jgi:LCP family protein required for cell wall assembly